MFKLIIITFSFFLFTTSSYSYLGPGVGVGVIAATLGLIVAIFAAVFGLIWFPIKRLIENRKKKKEKIQNKID